METVVERPSTLDVHKEQACVRGPRRGPLARAARGGVPDDARRARRARWLAGGAGVTLVGMEATGVYWKTVFQALEERFECWLLNAHHLRNVALV